MTKNYDNGFCGSLPLHLINLIQPYGVLIVVDKRDLSIVQVSENVHELLDVQASQAVKTTLDQYIPVQQVEYFRKKFNTGISGKLPFVLTITSGNKRGNHLTLVHEKADHLVLEVEKERQTQQSSFVDIFQELKYVMAHIEKATTLKEIFEVAIRELKMLSGFDKIMIYQFDEDWNGTVMAETLEPGMPEYLGLRFPASDVPRPARELYLKNPYRLIPSREYEPVRLYPVINPMTTAFIDLSECNLRSVPAVHIEYLKNMGVMASMSTRIIKDGKLWGLISCHHREAKYLNYEMCSLFELLSNIISAKISSVQNQEEFTFNAKLRSIQSRLMRQVYEKKELSEGLFAGGVSVLNLLNAGGAALVGPRQLKTIGKVPSTDQIKDMVYWLQTQPSNDVYHVTNLGGIYEQAQSYSDVASGIIALPIDAEKGEYIIGFRPEVVQEVNWGGNPDDALTFEPDNKTYHPRNSFRQWQQVVRNTSLPWLPGEVTAATEFRDFVLNNR